MSIEQGWEESYNRTENDPGTLEYDKIRPVKVEFEESIRVAPESTSWMSWPVGVIGISGTSRPTQVCPHRYHRYKAKFVWSVPANTTIYVARTEDALMSQAFGTAFTIQVGAGGFVGGGLMPEYDGQQPVYMMASQAGVVVSVMDEGYKPVQ
jgi:hypothetical protein